MIGEHVVTLTPDPSAPVWSPALASNPTMAATIAGWTGAPFTEAYPWTWAPPGVAKGQAVPTGSVGLFRDPAYPVLRDDQSGFYRVRTTTTIPAAAWVLPGIFFGTTPQAAHGGPFWHPDDAVTLASWIYCPSPGTYTLEAILDPSAVDARYTYLGPYVDYLFAAPMTPTNVDTLELTRQTFGEQVDITCLVDSVTIRHGRSDTTSQPEASTATLDLSLDTGAEALPDGLDVSGIIRVSTRLPDTTLARFVGKVTDVDMGWTEAGADTPEALICQVVATGELGDLGRRVVGDEPWPVELDGARVARIMAAAGLNLTPEFSDPGTVDILARDVDAQPALQMAQSVATSAGGMVWQTRDGLVRYADADHRIATTAGLRLGVCDVLVTPTWVRNTDGLINAVSIGYGVAPEGDGEGEQPRFTDENVASRERFGRFELSTATELADLADAESMGRLLLTRNAYPVWILGALPVDVAALDLETTGRLLSLDVHHLLEVTGLPAAGNLPTATAMWVEGWTETLAWGVHDLELNVSGFCRTAPPPEWDRVPSVWTWDAMPADATWDSAACFGPIQGFGRWVDVAATTRWDQLTNTQTWDTFTGETRPVGT